MSSPTSTLPPEMVSDVLSRLPVKSLLRFRCASKPLCSMIDDPYFAKLHLDRSAQTGSNQSLILTNCPLLHSIDLPSLERAVEIIDHPLKKLECETVVVGSCNGLLCLCSADDDDEVLVLWNMSTGKHLPVPSTPIVFPKRSDQESHRVAYGIGYDSVGDDYKLVRIVRFHNTRDSEVRVYSMKSNSWRKICGFPYDLIYYRSGGVLADGALHWLTNHPKDKGTCVVVTFDLLTEEFREVPMPPDAPYREPFVQLAALENRLCVIHSVVGKKTDMWMMKDCWAKLLSTSKPLVTGSVCCIIPVAYLSNGNGVMLLKDYKKFIRYDLKRNIVKNVRIEGLPASFDLMPYVDSLVNPLPMVKPTVGGDDAMVGKHKGRRGRRGKNNAAKRGEFLAIEFKLVL